MSLSASLRSFLPLVIGLAVGATGATLFLQSMPGSEGSPEEQARKLEHELTTAQHQIAALETAQATERTAAGRPSPERGRGVGAEARRIAEDIRAGRPVSPEDLFKASQPWLRDLSPLFDRMRVKTERQQVDSMVGEMARKYNLEGPEREALRSWFQQRAEQEGKRWSTLIAQDGTRLEDLMKASRDVRPDAGLDTFMPTILNGDELTAFQNERATQRSQRVEQTADRQVERINGLVGLDNAQQDQIYAIIARNSPDYDPSMNLTGSAGQTLVAPGGDQQTAILSVLRPDQRATYLAEQTRRRKVAADEMSSVGLALPPDWDMFND